MFQLYTIEAYSEDAVEFQIFLMKKKTKMEMKV